MPSDRFSRRQKQLALVALDLGIFALSLWWAFALRKSDLIPNFEGNYLIMLGVIAASRIPVYVKLGLYRAVLRYPSPQLTRIALQGMGVSMIFIGTLLYLLQLTGDPRSILIIEPFVSTLLVIASRELLAKWSAHRSATGFPGAPAPVLIYGAGSAGMQLAQTLRFGEDYHPVAFLDDEPSKWGLEVGNLKVFPPSRIEFLVNKYGIKQALLAAPASDAAHRRQMIDLLEKAGLNIMEVPNFLDLIRGNHRLEELEEVHTTDLLGRSTVLPDDNLLREVIPGRSVLVTGAGGSIGSELCRQVAELGPAQLVLFEINEYALYRIEMELGELYPDLKVAAILGSVLDEGRFEETCTRFGVESIYHAAAYKHVPLVEQNPLAGVRNNVFGTLSVARVAVRCGVHNFLMVSTDKAVRPCNVMGASKRVAELACLMAAEQSQESPFQKAAHPEATRFAIVRFGNVLDSAGSVVPLFRKQIASGGPVTVTDAEVQRYFMTIPEAAQLVVQASAMGSGGEVYLLDMGEPVKVVDLARRMIDLATSSCSREIAIEFTGLRPGEKLVEELLVDPACSEATSHPKIFHALEKGADAATVSRLLAQLDTAIDKGALSAVYGILEQLVESYSRPDAPKDVLDRERGGYSFHGDTEPAKESAAAE
ncbi:MAG: polysaccharide biosynthesis protein [Planctomycetota bacterium]|jgi:FlaA1/EpsC-like NDP-sugar epimerase